MISKRAIIQLEANQEVLYFMEGVVEIQITALYECRSWIREIFKSD